MARLPRWQAGPRRRWFWAARHGARALGSRVHSEGREHAWWRQHDGTKTGDGSAWHHARAGPGILGPWRWSARVRRCSVRAKGGWAAWGANGRVRVVAKAGVCVRVPTERSAGSHQGASVCHAAMSRGVRGEQGHGEAKVTRGGSCARGRGPGDAAVWMALTRDKAHARMVNGESPTGVRNVQ